MISTDGRYANSDITYVLNPKTGEMTATVFRKNRKSYAQSSRIWHWRYGDRLESISFKMYGTPKDWWRILDANPQIINPSVIAPGTSIRIP